MRVLCEIRIHWYALYSENVCRRIFDVETQHSKSFCCFFHSDKRVEDISWKCRIFHCIIALAGLLVIVVYIANAEDSTTTQRFCRKPLKSAAATRPPRRAVRHARTMRTHTACVAARSKIASQWRSTPHSRHYNILYTSSYTHSPGDDMTTTKQRSHPHIPLIVQHERQQTCAYIITMRREARAKYIRK